MTHPSPVSFCFLSLTALLGLFAPSTASADPQANCQPVPSPKVSLFPLTSVRLLTSPFADAVAANRTYMLALDPDRLLAPFLREAGLQPRAEPYGNWEGSGLGGHTAGHYLSALSSMIASGADTPDKELERRLNYMIEELARCQIAGRNGYIGGVPGGASLWTDVAAGHIDANGFSINGRWVPWYNLHKLFAGLRDAYLVAGNAQARSLFVNFGLWCEQLLSQLSDDQIQQMLKAEHGGMNEIMADLYAVTGDAKFLRAAQRFTHRAVIDPLIHHEDHLTGLHANTQIPKVIGLARIASLTGDSTSLSGAAFFWDNVTRTRSVAFGGNSVSEHFNDPADFSGMLESREGPETCNTYNMLRLTELLFLANPGAGYADYYERAIYNHLLSSINTAEPGYVYFTPIRPGHYRVYSTPAQCFWCCVGTGMENPGKYGEFIYAKAPGALFVNLFIPSELSIPELGLVLRQETHFPDEPRTRIILRLKEPTSFALRIRHPSWVADQGLTLRLNGGKIPASVTSSGYAEIKREWKNGDTLEIDLPMQVTAERLPDGSDWIALMYGPILLASESGTADMDGLRADGSRMGHVAHGPTLPLDQAPALLADPAHVAEHIHRDKTSETLRFSLNDIVSAPSQGGITLLPFFRLHDTRYQLYWQLSTPENLAIRREKAAAEEKVVALREAATLDRVAVGEQQQEVEHDFSGEETDSGLRDNLHWRNGRWFQYTLSTRNEKEACLAITYGNHDRPARFDILINGVLLAREELPGTASERFFEKRYPVPAPILAAAANGRITIKFSAGPGEKTARLFDLRLMRPAPPATK